MSGINGAMFVETPISPEVQAAADEYLSANPDASLARLAEHLVYEKDLRVTARMVSRLLRAHRTD